MIQMPLNDIIVKIKTNTSLTTEEITAKIDKKCEQLSGLISKEGAAQIIANELNIKLFETQGTLKVNQILSGMRNVETAGKVVRKFNISTFKGKDGNEGKVGSLILGDDTAQIRVTFWYDKTERLEAISEEDVIKITNAQARMNQGRVEIHLNDSSKVFINPDGLKIGEVAAGMSRPNATRKKVSELGADDTNIEVLGAIVGLYEPRFYEVCPECNKRARLVRDDFECPEHGKVDVAYSFVMNFYLDDGSGNIRVVCFKNQAKALMGMSDDEAMKLNNSESGTSNQEEFNKVKENLMGKFVKVIGRVNHNDMFDRDELVAQMVFIDPDPEEELKKLEKEE